MSVYATFTLLCENGREDDKLVKECRRYLEEYVRPLLGNDTFYVEDDRKLFHGHMYYTPPPSAERRAASAIRGTWTTCCTSWPSTWMPRTFCATLIMPPRTCWITVDSN